MMMFPSLQDRAWSSDEFWSAVNSAAEYAQSFNGEANNAAIVNRVLENVLFFSRPLGSA